MAEKDVTPSARARYKELCDTVPMEKLLDALHSRGGVYDEIATSTSIFGERHKELMKHSNDPTWKRVDQMTPEEYRERYEALIAEGIKPDPDGMGGRRHSPDGGIILCHHTHCGSKSCGFCKGRGVIFAGKDSLAHRTHCAKMSAAPKKDDKPTSWTPAAELQEMGKEEFKREILGGFPEPVKYNTQEFRQRIADQISAEIASGVFNVGEIPYSNGTQVLYTYYGPKAITTSTSTDIKLKEKEMNKSNDSEAKPVSVATQQRVMKVAETIDTIVDDTKSASVRAAASQFVKLTREPLVAALTRGLGMEDNETSRAAAARFLRSPLGDALVSGMLSMGVTALPVKGNLKNEISKELRIRAMSTAMDETVDLIMGPFRTVTGQLLQGGIELNLLEEGTPNTLKLETHIAEKVEVTDE